MARPRMKLSGDMPLFSTQIVQAATLRSWAGAIDMTQLHQAVIDTLNRDTPKGPQWVDFADSRQVASLLDVIHDAIPGTPCMMRFTGTNQFKFNQMTESDLLQLAVVQAAQPREEYEGLKLLLAIHVWRSMIKQKPGPLPGFNFNITIAGIATFCMLNRVHVEYESH